MEMRWIKDVIMAHFFNGLTIPLPHPTTHRVNLLGGRVGGAG